MSCIHLFFCLISLPFIAGFSLIDRRRLWSTGGDKKAGPYHNCGAEVWIINFNKVGDHVVQTSDARMEWTTTKAKEWTTIANGMDDD